MLCLALMVFTILTAGQFLPPATQGTGFRTIYSPVDGNVTIRFKSPPAGTCTTVFPTQKQYTGYVSLPPYTLAPIQQLYAINTFFWFIEARTDSSTAPLTIFINGGPGSSSMVGLFLENGPCEVIEIAQGKFGTKARDWGWDRSSNILYIDQPNEVGFSYDIRTNGSLDLFSSTVSFPPSAVPPGQPAYTFLNGTFSSNNPNRTTNTTETAAHAIWHMLQGFLGTFPQYNPAVRSNSTLSGVVGVNLFTESYGGKYGPAFAAHWEKQNQLIKSGSIPRKGLEIRLTSLGIMQGCVDDLVQGRFYPIFANNNTYGVQALSLVDQQAAASSYLSQDGCQQLIQSCRTAVASMDPENEGDMASVNQQCQTAQVSCNNNLIGPYEKSGRNVYDITQKTPDPFPPSTYLEYLNLADVQAAIGAAVNYTETNRAVVDAFAQTGDYERGDQISQMGSLLSMGVRVALIYGDRDFICNWVGGEAVSFSIAAQSPNHSPFYSAGYASIVVNSTYVGGAVRQYGNLSFSRIYDAGHLVPAYQAETAFTVFTRIIMGSDISLGKPVDASSFSSNGTKNATSTNTLPPAHKPTCYVRDIENSCSDQQKDLIRKGGGNVINGVLYSASGDWKAPASSVAVDAGYPGSVPSATATSSIPPGSTVIETSTSVVLTGVFVATSTPSTAKKGASSKGRQISSALLVLEILYWTLYLF
ncbi:hypothetical protein MMC07_004104 [Pseudocyphellaria aurata]|nr:hypothetical protein [Pseudocyphellaria aurata]